MVVDELCRQPVHGQQRSAGEHTTSPHRLQAADSFSCPHDHALGGDVRDGGTGTPDHATGVGCQDPMLVGGHTLTRPVVAGGSGPAAVLSSGEMVRGRR